MLKMTLALTAFVVPLCTPLYARPGLGAPVSLRYQDVGRMIHVQTGQEVELILPANLGSGVYWEPRSNDRYKLIKPPYIGADPAHVVRDATIIRLVLTSPGKTSVSVAAIPLGGGGGAASDVLKYRFFVGR
jgi:hypothetical protein